LFISTTFRRRILFESCIIAFTLSIPYQFFLFLFSILECLAYFLALLPDESQALILQLLTHGKEYFVDPDAECRMNRDN